MAESRIEFTEEAVKAYLDDAIRFWRKHLDEGQVGARYYIDAFQSVRTSLFGELLPGGMDD